MAVEQAIQTHVLTPLKESLNVRTALICIIVFFIISWVAQRRLHRIKNLPPGPWNWPMIGCAPQFLFKGLSLHDYFTFISERYGSVCLLPGPFGTNVVVVSGYEAVSETLTSSKFMGRPPFKSSFDDPLLSGQGKLLLYVVTTL